MLRYNPVKYRLEQLLQSVVLLSRHMVGVRVLIRSWSDDRLQLKITDESEKNILAWTEVRQARCCMTSQHYRVSGVDT